MKKQIMVITFIIMLFALCSFAESQQPGKVPQIGYISPRDPASESSRSEAIRLALRELGYIEGQNIAIEYRYAEGKPDRFPEFAAELVRFKVDVIVVPGGFREIQAARNTTKTIPLVMTGLPGDPVELELVEKLGRPGGNVTGLTTLFRELGGKRLELLKETVPKLAHVAVLYDAGSPDMVRDVKEESPSRGGCAGVDSSALGRTQCGGFRAGIRLAKQAAPGWALRILGSANAY